MSSFVDLCFDDDDSGKYNTSFFFITKLFMQNFLFCSKVTLVSPPFSRHNREEQIQSFDDNVE